MATLYAALGAAETTSNLYTVDPATGAMTSIGPIGFAMTGLAFDPTSGTLYGVTSNLSATDPLNLISIDPVTGAGTLIGPTNSVADAITDICFTSDGQMYGWGQNSKLVSIDKTTGQATVIGSGNTDATRGGGISAKSDNTLYVLNRSSTTNNLYTVDKASGVWTLVGTSVKCNCAAFNVADVLYANHIPSSSGAAPSTLATINIATGAASDIGAMTDNVDGLAWDVVVVTPPPPPVPNGATEVSVAFSAGTLAASPSVWTQLDDPQGTHIVSAFRIDRGRSSEFDKTGTGTASVDIFDTEGIVDPTNSSGPHFGDIDPMKQVRIRLRNPVTEEWHYLFKGFASEWNYEVDISGAFTKTTLDCADAFDLLAALEMTPGHHGDTPPANSLGEIYFRQGPPGTIGGAGPSRIHKALDDAGWPAGPREIFPGNVLLQETLYARRDQLLSVIFDAADAEFPGVANVYISKSGYVTFHGRYARFDPTNPDYGIQFWKVGTGPIAAMDNTVAPISGLRFRRSKSDIINAAQSIPQIPGGGDWTTAELATMLDKDDPSIAKYGWRSDSFDNLLTYKGRTDPVSTSFPTNAVNETKLFSQWRVHNYKNPKTRVEQIVFRPQMPGHFSGPAIWALMSEVEIGDIVTLHTEHPGGGGFDNEDFFVEGIHYDALPLAGPDSPAPFPDITLTLDVSPRSFYEFSPFGNPSPTQPVTQPAAVGPLSIIGILGGQQR